MAEQGDDLVVVRLSGSGMRAKGVGNLRVHHGGARRVSCWRGVFKIFLCLIQRILAKIERKTNCGIAPSA